VFGNDSPYFLEIIRNIGRQIISESSDFSSQLIPERILEPWKKIFLEAQNLGSSSEKAEGEHSEVNMERLRELTDQIQRLQDQVKRIADSQFTVNLVYVAADLQPYVDFREYTPELEFYDTLVKTVRVFQQGYDLLSNYEGTQLGTISGDAYDRLKVTVTSYPRHIKLPLNISPYTPSPAEWANALLDANARLTYKELFPVSDDLELWYEALMEAAVPDFVEPAVYETKILTGTSIFTDAINTLVRLGFQAAGAFGGEYGKILATFNSAEGTITTNKNDDKPSRPVLDLDKRSNPMAGSFPVNSILKSSDTISHIVTGEIKWHDSNRSDIKGPNYFPTENIVRKRYITKELDTSEIADFVVSQVNARVRNKVLSASGFTQNENSSLFKELGVEDLEGGYFVNSELRVGLGYKEQVTVPSQYYFNSTTSTLSPGVICVGDIPILAKVNGVWQLRTDLFDLVTF
jgi:hypothetical protein